MKQISHQQIVDILSSNGIAVIATDTIYGIVGLALERSTVERIYTLKKRTPSKPFIILISSVDDINLFGISLDDSLRQRLGTHWPGPVSIIIDCHNDTFEYLHRGTESLAFRLPAKPELVDIIKQTGPLVAPSANPEGLTPAANLEEAYSYFATDVDAYQEGTTSEKPSKIIKITDNEEIVIRP